MYGHECEERNFTFMYYKNFQEIKVTFRRNNFTLSKRYLCLNTSYFFFALSQPFPQAERLKLKQHLACTHVEVYYLQNLIKKFNSDAVLLSCFSETEINTTRQEHDVCTVKTSCSCRATRSGATAIQTSYLMYLVGLRSCGKIRQWLVIMLP